MAEIIHDNYWLRAPKPVDAKYGPWLTVEFVLHHVKKYMRYQGMTVGVLKERPSPTTTPTSTAYPAPQYDIVEYWFKDGIEDEDLIVKRIGGGWIGPPNEYEVHIGDTWSELTTGSEFRLLEFTYETDFEDLFDETFSLINKRYWVETTSPPVAEGLQTFTNVFDQTFDRDIMMSEEFNIWEHTFDNTFK